MSKPFHVKIMGSESEKERQAAEAAFAKVEALQKQKAIEDGIIRANQFKNETTGILGFARAIKYRNNQPHGLDQYRTMPKEDLQKLYVEFIDLTQRRGLPLASEDTDYGRIFLERLLDRPQPQPEPEPKTLKQKLIDMVT